MSAPINDGGPAFPFTCQGPTTAPEFYYGMTLRDWFAGQALMGGIANAHKLKQLGKINMTNSEDFCPLQAKHAYELADAMLAERNKTK